jgi:hypothetical protein
MSNFMSLNGKDVVKGLVVAALVAVLGSVQTILQGGNFPTPEEWGAIAKMAGSAIVSYLLKNLFTNSQDELFKKDA